MLNSYEKVGRWLCQMYYAPNTKRELPIMIRNLIEDVIKREKVWLSLMSGDLRNLSSRKIFLGDAIEELPSIDGKENLLRVKELSLYSIVGQNMVKTLL